LNRLCHLVETGLTYVETMADARTLGVEEELHVVDLESGRLSARAPQLLRSLPGEHFSVELQRTTVETNSRVVRSLGDLRAEIIRLRGLVNDLAAMDGLEVIATGTAPVSFAEDFELTALGRFSRMQQDYRFLVDDQLICGLQVHVGVEDRDTAVRVLQRIAGDLPTLLALSASSPYWQGKDTGYASFRTMVWQRWPSAGSIGQLKSAAEYDRMVEDLIASGVISDAKMAYFDARPSAHVPTVELRVCDACPLVDDAVLIAGLFRAMVDAAVVSDRAGQPSPVRREPLHRAAMWRAARSGLSGPLLDGGPAPVREFDYSDIVARRFGTDHHRIKIDSTRLLPAIDGAVAAMSEPMVSHDCVAFYLLSQDVARSVKVVQSGQGADEILGGYDWYPPLATVAREDAVDAYARGFFDRPYAHLADLLNPEWLDEVDAPREFIVEQFARSGAETSVDAALRNDTTIMLVDDPVKRVDNMTMAAGLEARVPFLDHDVVELAALIPPEQKLADGGKGVLKRASRGIVPDAVIDRTKGYFPVPAIRQLDGPYLARVRDALTEPAAKRRGLFRPETVEKMLADPNRTRTTLGSNALWQLALIEMWLQAMDVH